MNLLETGAIMKRCSSATPPGRGALFSSPSAVRGGVVPLTSSPGTSCTPWSVRTGDLAATAELFAGGPAPMEWLGSDQPPFFPDDVAEKLLNVGGPAQQRPGGEGRHARFALLKQALHSAPVLRKNGTAEP